MIVFAISIELHKFFELMDRAREFSFSPSSVEINLVGGGTSAYESLPARVL